MLRSKWDIIPNATFSRTLLYQSHQFSQKSCWPPDQEKLSLANIHREVSFVIRTAIMDALFIEQSSTPSTKLLSSTTPRSTAKQDHHSLNTCSEHNPLNLWVSSVIIPALMLATSPNHLLREFVSIGSHRQPITLHQSLPAVVSWTPC